MKNRLFALTLALGVAVLAAAPAQATLVRPLTVEQMSTTANVIVRARVERAETRWNDERTRVYTFTDLTVLDVLKGPVAPGETVRVRQIGGTIDGLTQSVAGNAKFTVGEEIIVFLDRDDAAKLHFVIGMAQGKFTVDRRAGEPQVVRALDGLSFVGPDRPTLAPAEAPRVLAPTLGAFEARIRGALPAP